MKSRLSQIAKQIVSPLVAIPLFAVAPLASGMQPETHSGSSAQSADLTIGIQPRPVHPLLVMDRTINGPVNDGILHLTVYISGLVTVSRATFQRPTGPPITEVQTVDFAF